MAASAKQARYPGEGSPWADFLHHRARALRWLRDASGKSHKHIVETMQLDEVQVSMILHHVDSSPAVFPAELGVDGKSCLVCKQAVIDDAPPGEEWSWGSDGDHYHLRCRGGFLRAMKAKYGR